METFVTKNSFELSNNGDWLIYIPPGIKVTVEHMSGDWWRLKADCFLTKCGKNEVLLGDVQIKKLKGE